VASISLFFIGGQSTRRAAIGRCCCHTSLLSRRSPAKSQPKPKQLHLHSQHPHHPDADGHPVADAARGGAIRRRPPASCPLRRPLFPVPRDARHVLVLPGAPRVPPLPLRGLLLRVVLVRRGLGRRRAPAVWGDRGGPQAVPVAPRRWVWRRRAGQRGVPCGLPRVA
jgi:hypothetical protein